MHNIWKSCITSICIFSKSCITFSYFSSEKQCITFGNVMHL
ncbi:hypothetical protein METSMIALI_00350 [Methanobrevibacter smithii DSM 2375]|uniref:Uncharacterized protein n=1 Tax=Methanobrevibacter smithii DSM 2375 TaxID=483214 RepID=B9ADC7_METSM|nr:hypothetical protein METSMIALI_00350 [Methanobrevibacter smithii DSM 2375]